MADTSFRVLSSPYPKQRKPRSPETNRTIWILLPSRRSLLDPPQCLVHAAHEILIFLDFETHRDWPRPSPGLPKDANGTRGRPQDQSRARASATDPQTQILKRVGRWQDVGYDYQRLPEPKQSPGRALSDQEYERLFRVAQSRPEWEMAYLFAAISVNTTCGPKEVYTLRLRDVNLEEGFLRVQPDGAKNTHRIRVIPLNPIARAAIERVLELAGKRGSKQPDHYLFPFRLRGNGTWGIYDPTQRCKSCQGAWRKLVVAAGLKGLRPYDLRHTAITDLLSNPEASIETCKSIAGHVSAQIIKTYAHINLSAKRTALDSLFRGRSGKQASRHHGRSVSPHTFKGDCGVAVDVEEENASEEVPDVD
jgi:integrase